MSDKRIQLLVKVVAWAAIVVYLGTVVLLGVPNWRPGSDNGIKVVSGILTAVGGGLATFFGAVVGLNQARPAAAWLARQLKQPQPAGPLATVVTLSWLQVGAAWTYFGSLVLALGLWWLADDFSEKTPPAVISLALSLPGVMAGVLAVALSLRLPGQNQ